MIFNRYGEVQVTVSSHLQYTKLGIITLYFIKKNKQIVILHLYILKETIYTVRLFKVSSYCIIVCIILICEYDMIKDNNMTSFASADKGLEKHTRGKLLYLLLPV